MDLHFIERLYKLERTILGSNLAADQKDHSSGNENGTAPIRPVLGWNFRKLLWLMDSTPSRPNWKIEACVAIYHADVQLGNNGGPMT